MNHAARKRSPHTARRRAFTALLLAVPMLAIGGAASAYLSAAGAGIGSGTNGTNVAVTLSPATPAFNLFPGSQGNVVLTVWNPNDSSVRIGSLALDTTQGTGGFSVDAGHAGCAVSTLSFTTQTNGGAGWVVPKKVGALDGTLSVTLSNALAMGIGAANACQGASATIYLVAGP